MFFFFFIVNSSFHEENKIIKNSILLSSSTNKNTLIRNFQLSNNKLQQNKIQREKYQENSNQNMLTTLHIQSHINDKPTQTKQQNIHPTNTEPFSSIVLTGSSPSLSLSSFLSSSLSTVCSSFIDVLIGSIPRISSSENYLSMLLTSIKKLNENGICPQLRANIIDLRPTLHSNHINQVKHQFHEPTFRFITLDTSQSRQLAINTPPTTELAERVTINTLHISRSHCDM